MIPVLLLLASLAAAADPRDANEAAIRRRPRAMSLTLVDLADTADDTQRAQVAYYLGRCFEQIGLLQSAHRQFVRALSSPTWRSRSLSGLVRTAERIGDDEPLLPIAAAVDPASFSPSFAGALWFARGRQLARDGQPAAATAALEAVAPTSPRYPAAQLHLAVLQHERGASEAARDTLLRLLSLRAPRSQLARIHLGAVQQLARLDLARLYYGAHRFEEATRIYATLDEDGPYAALAALESGWASLILGDEAAARAGAAAGGERILAAELWLHLEPARADPDAWASEAAAIAAAEDHYAASPGALWRDWFSDGADTDVPVPDAFFDDALRDVRLAGAALRLRQIRAEEVLVADQDPAWQETFGAALAERLATDRAEVEDRAGRLLLARLAARREGLTALVSP